LASDLSTADIARDDTRLNRWLIILIAVRAQQDRCYLSTTHSVEAQIPRLRSETAITRRGLSESATSSLDFRIVLRYRRDVEFFDSIQSSPHVLPDLFCSQPIAYHPNCVNKEKSCLALAILNVSRLHVIDSSARTEDASTVVKSCPHISIYISSDAILSGCPDWCTGAAD
jgi:hypothetical protein